MRPAVVALVLVAMLAAGALRELDHTPRPHAVLADPQVLPTEDGPVRDIVWPEGGQVECHGACRLAVPGGKAGDLWVVWDGSNTVGFTAALDGVPAIPAFDSAWLGPIAGAQELRLWGEGGADLIVIGRAVDVPELAALVPANLGQALGAPRGHGDVSLTVPNCLEVEVVELGVHDCLRFTTGLANVGGVALALSSDDRTSEARMVQALPGGDRSVGYASYHASHGHFHYAHLVSFSLFVHDPVTGLREEAVLGAGKTGFCLVDFGKVADAPTASGKTYWRDGCAPREERLDMGINAGWYDIYRWFLPEQVIDPTGLPDGTYELVVTIDPFGSLVEGNPLDNRASVVFAWQGGVATTVAEHGLYRLSPQPS